MASRRKQQGSGKRRGRSKRNAWSAKTWLLVVGIALIVLVPAGWRIYEFTQLPGERFASQGHVHIPQGADPPNYNSNPPTSGPHYAALASAGVHSEAPPDPLLVHNMEDGYVVLWYKPGTEEETEERIQNLQNAAQGYRMTVIVPREEMDYNYALTAWTRLDAFDEFDLERARNFVDAYHGIDNHPRR